MILIDRSIDYRWFWSIDRSIDFISMVFWSVDRQFFNGRQLPSFFRSRVAIFVFAAMQITIHPSFLPQYKYALTHAHICARVHCFASGFMVCHPSYYLSFTPNRINCVTGSGTGNGYRQPWPKCKFLLDSRQYPLVRISNCAFVCVDYRLVFCFVSWYFYMTVNNNNNNDKQKESTIKFIHIFLPFFLKKSRDRNKKVSHNLKFHFFFLVFLFFRFFSISNFVPIFLQKKKKKKKKRTRTKFFFSFLLKMT